MTTTGPVFVAARDQLAQATLRCTGCGAPLHEAHGLNTCATADCPGNLHPMLTALYGDGSNDA